MPKSYNIRVYEREYEMIKEKSEELNVSTSQAVAELIKDLKMENKLLRKEVSSLEKEVEHAEAYVQSFKFEIPDIVQKEVNKKIEGMVEADIIRYVRD